MTTRNVVFPNVVSVNRKVTIADEQIALNYNLDFSSATPEELVKLAVDQAVVNVTNGLFRKLTVNQVRGYQGKTVAYNAKAGKPDVNQIMRAKLRTKGFTDEQIDELLA